MTRIDDVCGSLTDAAPTMVTIQAPDTFLAYKSLLEEGATDAQRMLVISDLARRGDDLESCARALSLAHGEPSGAGLPRNRSASRAVALVASLRNLDWLLELAASPDANDSIMTLERYTSHTLPLRWRGEKVIDAIGTGSLAQDVLRVTDGWPSLVEDLAERATPRAGRATRAIVTSLEQMQDQQSDPDWCRSFLEQCGAVLPSWPDMARLVEVLVEYDAPCTPTDMSVLAMDRVNDVDRTARLAQWLGVVTVTGSNELALSTLVTRCWRTSGMPSN